MSGDVQMTVYFQEYKTEALTSVLKKQGATVEERIQEYLSQLYELHVPSDVQSEIQARIDAEQAAWEAEQEAARRYTIFHVRENGADAFFQLERQEDLLEVGKSLRYYLRQETGNGTDSFTDCLKDRLEIGSEGFNRMMWLFMENCQKVTGVFDLDFDKRELSTAHSIDGWRTYAMKDVSSATYHAFRSGYISYQRRLERFQQCLSGKEISSSGHLSAKDISLAEEICEMDGHHLNFYLETCFDIDAVFGTHVCTAENDDTLNVYADYDMAAGEVCDELEVDLHWADGREEAVKYRLNAVEKSTLLRKMEDYCFQQTGQTLKEYSAQLLAEDMAPPVVPSM